MRKPIRRTFAIPQIYMFLDICFVSQPRNTSNAVCLTLESTSLNNWCLRVYWQWISKQMRQDLQRHEASKKPSLAHSSSYIPQAGIYSSQSQFQ